MVATLGCAIGTLPPYLITRRFFDVVSALLRIEDGQGARYVFSFSYALASIVGAILIRRHSLRVSLRRVDFSRRCVGHFSRAAAALLGGAGAYVALSLFSPLFPSTETLPVFRAGFLGGVSGIIATAFDVLLLGSREY